MQTASSVLTRAVFVAYGTRGDVQPLACLACHLQHSYPGVQATLVTHEAHKSWLEPDYKDRVTLHYVQSLPARKWADSKPEDRAPGRASAGQEEGQEQQDRDYMSTYEAVTALLPAAGDATQRALIVFNLFALECYHISEALKVPCAVAAPYLIPYRCPNGFRNRFKRALPALYNILTADTNDSTPASGAETLSPVSWKEVEHWMWPLFNAQRWSALRQHLHLPPVPLCNIDEKPLQPLPPAPLLLYGSHRVLLAHSVRIRLQWSSGTEAWILARISTRVWVLAAKRMLAPAAFTNDTSDQPGQSVLGKRARENDHNNQDTSSSRVLGCVDFGSMGLIGLIPDPCLLVRTLSHALQRVNRRAFLLSAAWEPLHAAVQALPHPFRDTLRVVERPVDHAALLPKCAFVMHTGGSGTTAAALTAGTPQVLVPLQFDQFFHAERLHDLGLAPAPIKAELLVGTAATTTPPPQPPTSEAHARDQGVTVLSEALQWTLGPGVAGRCRDFAQDLSAETSEALPSACRLLMSYAASSYHSSAV